MVISRSKENISEFAKWKFLVFYFFAGAILTLFVFFRPINHDETYYLISAKSMFFEGKMPYLDFVFHQMPLMLFAYMPVCNFGIYSLFAGRILSCIFLIISYLILSKTFFKDSDSQSKFLFTVLFWLNIFLIDWAVTIKIYSLSILLFSSGIYYYFKFLQEPGKTKYLYPASLFFSLLLFTKIVFALNVLFIILFSVYIILRKRTSGVTGSAIDNKLFFGISKVIMPFLVTLILPAITFWIYLKPDLNKLYFDIYLINSMYLPLTRFSEDFKVFILFFIFPQNLIVSALSFFSFKELMPATTFILINYVLFFSLHLFSRMLTEYHVTFLPLLIVLSVMGYRKLIAERRFPFGKFTPKNALYIILILYIVTSPLSIYHFKQYLFNGKLPPNPVELSYFVNELNGLKGKTVLSSWEGLTAFSNKETIYKENYAVSYIYDFIDPDTKNKYGLISTIDYRRLVTESIPDIIVLDATDNAFLSGMETIIESNYRISFVYKFITVYSKKKNIE
ncbi:MAG: hypothetical protein ABI543_01365 [Ignavibacteria bacterium]